MDDLLQRDIANIASMREAESKRNVGIRKHAQCIFKGLPNKTTVGELIALILELVPSVTSPPRVNINYPEKPKIVQRFVTAGIKESCEVYSLNAFVFFSNDTDSKNVVSFFQSYTESNIGFEIINNANVAGRIFCHFVYTRDDDHFFDNKINQCDVRDLPKKQRSVVLYGIPLSTTKEELAKFLMAEINVTIANITLKETYHKRTLTGFVTLENNGEEDVFVKHFKIYNHTGVGLLFENAVGVSSTMFASYQYIKKDRRVIENEFVLLNLPSGTTQQEMIELLNSNTKSNVAFISKTRNVWFFKTDDHNTVEEIIVQFSIYPFTNKQGCSSSITADYRYIKSVDYDKGFLKNIDHLKNIKSNETPRKPKCIYISNIPVKTDDNEIILMLLMINPNWEIKEIFMKDMVRQGQLYSLSAKILFESDEECKEVHEYFKSYLEEERGYLFQNYEGVTSKLLVDFYFSNMEEYNVNCYGTVKLDRNIVIWNLPKDLKIKDLSTIIQEVCPSVNIKNVTMKQKKQNDKQYAFVVLNSNEECDVVVETFQQTHIRQQYYECFVNYVWTDENHVDRKTNPQSFVKSAYENNYHQLQYETGQGYYGYDYNYYNESEQSYYGYNYDYYNESEQDYYGYSYDAYNNNEEYYDDSLSPNSYDLYTINEEPSILQTVNSRLERISSVNMYKPSKKLILKDIPYNVLVSEVQYFLENFFDFKASDINIACRKDLKKYCYFAIITGIDEVANKIQSLIDEYENIFEFVSHTHPCSIQLEMCDEIDFNIMQAASDALILVAPNSTEDQIINTLHSDQVGLEKGTFILTYSEGRSFYYLKLNPSDRDCVLLWFNGVTVISSEMGVVTAKYKYTNADYVTSKSTKNNLRHIDSGLMFYNIPKETTTEELCTFIVNEANVKPIKIIIFSYHKACVSFLTDTDCDQVLLKFKTGLTFSNIQNNKATINANYLRGEKSTRNYSKFMLKNLPDNTKSEEITDLISEKMGVSLCGKPLCVVFTAKESRGHLAVVQMPSIIECNEIILYLSENDQGHCFTNKEGKRAFLKVEPFYDIMQNNFEDNIFERQVQIFNLPEETSVKDVIQFICDPLVNMSSIKNIVLKNAANGTLTAFIDFTKTEHCNEFMRFLSVNNMSDVFTFYSDKGSESDNVVVKRASPKKSQPPLPLKDNMLCTNKSAVLRNEIVISNIPDSTTSSEFVSFLTSVIPDIKEICGIRVFEPEKPRKVFINDKPHKWYRYKYFIVFYTMNDRNSAMEYFTTSQKNCWFRNKQGDCSLLSTDIVYDNYKEMRNEVEVQHFDDGDFKEMHKDIKMQHNDDAKLNVVLERIKSMHTH